MKPTERAAELTYALQAGEPFRTVKRYAAGTTEWRVVVAVFRMVEQRRPDRRWRIVLLPFNVLAADTAWYFSDAYPQDLPVDHSWRSW